MKELARILSPNGKVVPYLVKFDAPDRHRYGLNIEKDDIYFCRLG
jgi:hypothetical protein